MCNLLTSPFHYHLLPAGTSWELFSSFKHKNSYQMYLYTVFQRTLIIFLHESCRNILILSIFWVNIVNSFCCICQAPYISERSMPHVSFGYGTPPRQLLIFCTFTAQDELSHPQTRVWSCIFFGSACYLRAAHGCDCACCLAGFPRQDHLHTNTAWIR